MEVNDEYSNYLNNGIEDEDEILGIEDEAEEIEILNDPFNPEDISISSKVISMENCLRRLVQGTINLNPDFQRKEVWTLVKKSQLIESLMLKIPLPMFYVSADEKGNYTVVDGLQRLSTIRDFILGTEYLKSKDISKRGEGFRLEQLEFWVDYNTKNFNGLSTHIQNRILETEFTFTVINPGTPEEVKRNIFKRINTGGLPLSSQEIRNALYLGKSTLLLNELAAYNEFKQATSNSIKENRMEDKELILRFLAFLIRDYKTYRRTISVDSFLSDTMIIINALPNYDTRDLLKAIDVGSIQLEDITKYSLDSIKENFKLAMERSYKLFGHHAFRRSYLKKRRTPINKSLFEMWAVLLSKLSTTEFETLNQNKNKMMDSYVEILDKIQFRDDLSKNSMKHASIKVRFETIENLINSYKI